MFEQFESSSVKFENTPTFLQRTNLLEKIMRIVAHVYMRGSQTSFVVSCHLSTNEKRQTLKSLQRQVMQKRDEPKGKTFLRKVRVVSSWKRKTQWKCK